MEHVVSELQDEGYGQPQESCDKYKSHWEDVVPIKEAAVPYLPPVLGLQTQHQPIEQHPEGIQFAVLREDAFSKLVPVFQDLFVVDVSQGRYEALH